MRTRILVPLLVGVLVAGSAGGWWWWTHRSTPTTNASTHASAGASAGRRPSGPISVSVALAAPAEVPVTREAIGTVVPLAAVTVRAQLSGRLDQVLYQEGSMVQAGEVLARIDDRPYRLAQQQYEGQWQRDQAQLAQAEQDLARYRTLVEQDSLARQTLDQQDATVAQLRGAVAVDRAQIDTAKLNQTYCHVTAPIAGRLGLRLVNAGSYVTPTDSTGLVTITQTAPIAVDFVLPETDVPLLVPTLRTGRALAVQIRDRDGTTRLAEGTVTAIDNAIDTTTGTVKIRATLPNADERLFPNQFVNVHLDVDRHHAAVAVPLAAVLHGPHGAFVWVVQDNTAHQRSVTMGISAGDQVEITTGVAVGDQLVVDGVDLLRDGAAVTIATNSPAAGSTNSTDHPHRRRATSAADG